MTEEQNIPPSWYFYGGGLAGIALCCLIYFAWLKPPVVVVGSREMKAQLERAEHQRDSAFQTATEKIKENDSLRVIAESIQTIRPEGHAFTPVSRDLSPHSQQRLLSRLLDTTHRVPR